MYITVVTTTENSNPQSYIFTKTKEQAMKNMEELSLYSLLWDQTDEEHVIGSSEEESSFKVHIVKLNEKAREILIDLRYTLADFDEVIHMSYEEWLEYAKHETAIALSQRGISLKAINFLQASIDKNLNPGRYVIVEQKGGVYDLVGFVVNIQSYIAAVLNYRKDVEIANTTLVSEVIAYKAEGKVSSILDTRSSRINEDYPNLTAKTKSFIEVYKNFGFTTKCHKCESHIDFPEDYNITAIFAMINRNLCAKCLNNETADNVERGLEGHYKKLKESKKKVFKLQKSLYDQKWRVLGVYKNFYSALQQGMKYHDFPQNVSYSEETLRYYATDGETVITSDLELVEEVPITDEIISLETDVICNECFRTHSEFLTVENLLSYIESNQEECPTRRIIQ